MYLSSGRDKSEVTLTAIGRRAAIGVLAAILLLVLSGCDIGVKGNNISLGRSGDALLIAPCADLVVTAIRAEQRNRTAGQEWTTFWDGTGRMKMTSGETISTAVEPAGIESKTRSNPSFAPGAEVDIILSMPGSDSYYNSVGLDELVDGGWINRDGEAREAPCTD